MRDQKSLINIIENEIESDYGRNFHVTPTEAQINGSQRSLMTEFNKWLKKNKEQLNDVFEDFKFLEIPQ